MFVFIFNTLIYLLTVFYYLKKDKGWNVFNYLLFYYAIIAAMGAFIFNNGIYQHVFGPKTADEISLIPYILCFASYFILFYPFRKLSKNLHFKMPQIKRLNEIIIIWIILMTAYCVVKFIEATITIQMGFLEVYEMRHMEGETIFEYTDNFFLKRLRNVGVVLQGCTVPIVMLYCVDCLRNKKNLIKVTILFVLSFLPDCLDGIALASRGHLFSVAIKIAFFYVLLKDYLSNKIKKISILMVLLGLFFMGMYSMRITASRFEDSQSETPIESIARYFGESFPNLGYSFWNKVQYHPMGERLFPELYGYSKKERFASTSDAQMYWEAKTKVPVLNFKTIFGDLYIEFGSIGAILFIIVFSYLFTIFMNGKITYYNIGISYLYFQICSMGFAGITKMSGLNLIIWLLTFIIGYSLKISNNNTK